jgi:4-aminobutyrate aminotransferase-like enzyme
VDLRLVFEVWRLFGVWCLVFGVSVCVHASPLKTKTNSTLRLLRTYESRNVTFMERNGSWPIVWQRARGVHVWDAEGRKYLDLTAAFGVAAAGHANPRVIRAGQRQMATLLHAMGDVHPHALKAQLARELSRITFERWTTGKAQGGKAIFCNSGFEAVEAALKTALLATGKRGVIAFEGGYHGLGYGALTMTHREHFRAPFRSQLPRFGQFVPFPVKVGRGVPTAPRFEARKRRAEGSAPHLERIMAQICSLLRKHPIGAILVEPIQARGGIRIPPPDFLPRLRRVCDEHGVLLILDEIYTGFGRTGAWFACEHSSVVPDLICLGKALTGGFPLSACVGRASVMDAWPTSTGEAIHTSTFLGHPVGCAMALANIAEIRTKKLVGRSAALGKFLLRELFKVQDSTFKVQTSVRGMGLMAGLELVNPDGSPATGLSLRAIKELLRRGFIFLPEGEYANVISFTPPLTIWEPQLRSAVRELGKVLHDA